MTDETTTEPGEGTFFDAVLEMGKLFQTMQVKYKVPPAITLDIVRIQLMYMAQSQAAAGQTRVPLTAPPEVLAAEAAEALND